MNGPVVPGFGKALQDLAAAGAAAERRLRGELDASAEAWAALDIPPDAPIIPHGTAATNDAAVSAYRDAIREIRIEIRWQRELQLRASADDRLPMQLIIDRLSVLDQILTDRVTSLLA